MAAAGPRKRARTKGADRAVGGRRATTAGAATEIPRPLVGTAQSAAAAEEQERESKQKAARTRSSEADEVQFETGQRVIISGLSGAQAQALNGLLGEIVGWIQDRKRYNVRVGDNEVAVRSTNLALAPVGSPASATPAALGASATLPTDVPAAASSAAAHTVSASAPAASLAGAPAASSSSAVPSRPPRPAPARLAFLRLGSSCEPSVPIDQLVYLNKDEVTFGRLPTCDVVLDSRRVPQMISRLHGRLQRRLVEGEEAPRWFIIDNKSMNGIMVNGEAVGEAGYALRSLDAILFGRKMAPPEFEFVFEDPNETDIKAAEPECNVDALLAEPLQRISELQQELEAEREQAREKKTRARTVMDFADLQSELVCSICQDWLVQSATIDTCSHTFCSGCIEQWLLQKKFECPVCRSEVVRSPVTNRTVDSIVQKTLDKANDDEKKDFADRLAKHEKAKAKASKLHKDLEKSVEKAISKGRAFFKIDSHWNRREKDTFQRGIKDYVGDTRETYCKLAGLTVQWVHSADEDTLNQALHNLGLQRFVGRSETDVRQRLLMFLRYG